MCGLFDNSERRKVNRDVAGCENDLSTLLRGNVTLKKAEESTIGEFVIVAIARLQEHTFTGIQRLVERVLKNEEFNPNYHYRETISLGDEWYGRLSDNVRIRGAKSLACLAMSGEARSEDCEEANELRKEANKAELAVSSRFGQPCAIPRQAAGFANTNILILRPSAKKIKPDGSVSVVGKRRVTIVVRKSN
ncbi:hypothetical protein U1Q18_051728 [Sarracenia purpurea var. burkii]